jgi:hypothetical protein
MTIELLCIETLIVFIQSYGKYKPNYYFSIA